MMALARSNLALETLQFWKASQLMRSPEYTVEYDETDISLDACKASTSFLKDRYSELFFIKQCLSFQVVSFVPPSFKHFTEALTE
jgi:hypothetical protein